ncbi:MAG: hypothetical protein J7456_15935, partial [Chloroflexus sp.]|nr:hypothetical protein [Chloroflexus sp.]
AGGGGIAMDATQFTISLALQELLQQKSLKTTCRMHMRSMLWQNHRQGHGMPELRHRRGAQLCPYVWIRDDPMRIGS